MTKRESAKIVAQRRKAQLIERALKRAEELELDKPLDVAYMVLSYLAHDEERERRVKGLLRHMKADPHCSCSDCLAIHQMTTDGYTRRQALALHTNGPERER